MVGTARHCHRRTVRRRLLCPGHGARSDPAGGVAPRGGMGSLRLPDCCRLALFVARAGPLLSGCRPRPRAADGAGRGARRCHGGGPTRGGAVPDLPLIKAAKLWAKVSARTGAAYMTGRWGGCRVLVFENLERKSEAEPSHFLFLGEAGEWPHPDQAAAPVTAPEPVREVAELRAVPAAPVEDGAGEKPARRRRKARVAGAAEPPAKPRKARKRREGWNGSVYRRPRDGAAAPAEAVDEPFIEDPLDDIGRG